MHVVIVGPRAEWSGEFEALSSRLRTALGPLALRVEHIGSTSVPGLAAKDVIDAQVTVQSLDAEPGLAACFAAAGLVTRRGGGKLRDHVPAGWEGDETAWDKLLFGAPDGERRANVHVRVAGSPNERYALLFRDFLRANDRARDLWGSFKEQLAAETGGELDLYLDLKDPASDVLMATAEAWARSTGWRP
jgi:GrpB-like predicted nucleotidyltransferase (UPF0157 family)